MNYLSVPHTAFFSLLHLLQQRDREDALLHDYGRPVPPEDVLQDVLTRKHPKKKVLPTFHARSLSSINSFFILHHLS